MKKDVKIALRKILSFKFNFGNRIVTSSIRQFKLAFILCSHDLGVLKIISIHDHHIRRV